MIFSLVLLPLLNVDMMWIIFFKFEISPYPPSLFKDVFMHKIDKPTLRKVFLKDGDRVNVDTVLPSSYVLEGRALFHQLWWLKGATYKDFAYKLMSYVCRHYNITTLQPLSLTVTTTLYQRRQMHIPEDPLLGFRTL